MLIRRCMICFRKFGVINNTSQTGHTDGICAACQPLWYKLLKLGVEQQKRIKVLVH